MLKNAKIILILVAIVIFICLSNGFSQNNNFERNTDILLSKGINITPTGNLYVTTYKLEKVPSGMPVEFNDGKPQINYGYRLSIKTSKELPSNGFIIWIGDEPHSATWIGPKTVGSVFFKRTLPDNATLALSVYGDNDENNRSVLLEKLRVPAEYATSQEEIEKSRPKVRITAHVAGFPYYNIIVDIPDVPCYLGATIVAMKIGESYISPSCSKDSYVSTHSVENFAQLRQGDPISILIGTPPTGRIIKAGLLDKSTVED